MEARLGKVSFCGIRELLKWIKYHIFNVLQMPTTLRTQVPIKAQVVGGPGRG